MVLVYFNTTNQDLADAFMEATQHPTDISPELARDMKELWSDQGIQQSFKQSNQFQLYDSTEYYYENFDRIMGPNYIPTDQDILRSRAKTTGRD